MEQAVLIATQSKDEALAAIMGIRCAETKAPEDERLPVIVCGHHFDDAELPSPELVDGYIDVHPTDYVSLFRSLPSMRTLLQTRPVVWQVTAATAPQEYIKASARVSPQIPVYGLKSFDTGRYAGPVSTSWMEHGNTNALGEHGATHGLEPLYFRRMDILRDLYGLTGAWLPAYDTAVSVFSQASGREVADMLKESMYLDPRPYVRTQPLLSDYLNIASAMYDWYPRDESGRIPWIHEPLTLTASAISKRAQERAMGISSMHGSHFPWMYIEHLEAACHDRLGYGFVHLLQAHKERVLM